MLTINGIFNGHSFKNKSLDYFKIVNVTSFLLLAVSSLFILKPFEAITIAWWAQQSPDNTRQRCGISTHRG
jgi:hypothetical protein